MVVEQIAILTLLGEAEPSKRFNMNKFDMRMMDLLHWNEVEINCIDNAGKENPIRYYIIIINLQLINI